MKVRISKDWDAPNLFRQTPGNLGMWEDVSFTLGNQFDVDILLVLNAPPKTLFGRCRDGGLWLMSQEPPHENYWWQTKKFKYFDNIYTFWDKDMFPNLNIINHQTSLPWHVNKSYDELILLNDGANIKTNSVSWVTSNLNTRPGHALRLDFMRFLQDNKFPFFLFGRGFKEIDDKFEAIYPHKYSIAIENFTCNDYWTEKIADCFLSWTMPIYSGCKNITKYFPAESIIIIDPSKPAEALKIIQEAMSNDKWSKNIEYIKESRELILNKYQLFPSIVSKIKKQKLGSKKFYCITK